VTGNDSFEAAIARLEGKIDTLIATVNGQLAQIQSSVEFGDRQNAQKIEYVSAEVARAHTRIDAIMDPETGELARRDDRIDKNRRLVWTSFVGPVVTAVIIAMLLYAIGLHP
jgi:hypothetical protein